MNHLNKEAYISALEYTIDRLVTLTRYKPEYKEDVLRAIEKSINTKTKGYGTRADKVYGVSGNELKEYIEIFFNTTENSDGTLSITGLKETQPPETEDNIDSYHPMPVHDDNIHYPNLDTYRRNLEEKFRGYTTAYIQDSEAMRNHLASIGVTGREYQRTQDGRWVRRPRN